MATETYLLVLALARLLLVLGVVINFGMDSHAQAIARGQIDPQGEPRHRPHGRAQEILLEELHVEISNHMKVRHVEVHVLFEEGDHE